MLFSTKQVHPWSCDMSRGDVQCPFISPNSSHTGHLSCTWKIGHPDSLPHEICHNQTDQQVRNRNNWELPKPDTEEGGE